MSHLLRRIDIHAHVQSSEFDEDRDAVLVRALESGTAMINVGTDLVSSQKALALAERHDAGIFAIVGLHPTDTNEKFDPEAYRALLKHPKVVGVGECGLDYFRLSADPLNATPEAQLRVKAAQKDMFIAQIALANEAGKPLMLHIRSSDGSSDAYVDAVTILKEHAKVPGNSHFFAGTVQDAKAFLDIGCTMSFTGVITFAKQYIELVEYVPLEMMHVETDCPFVAPVPHRGKRNEPSYVSEVVNKIARIKKLPVEQIEEALLANAQRMFGVSL